MQDGEHGGNRTEKQLKSLSGASGRRGEARARAKVLYNAPTPHIRHSEASYPITGTDPRRTGAHPRIYEQSAGRLHLHVSRKNGSNFAGIPAKIVDYEFAYLFGAKFCGGLGHNW